MRMFNPWDRICDAPSLLARCATAAPRTLKSSRNRALIRFRRRKPGGPPYWDRAIEAPSII